MKIIVGLGNPGDQYKNTRHNAGWIFIDQLVPNAKWQLNKKFNALTHEEGETIFVKPLTYMNESGQSVYKLMSYYNLIPKNLGLFSKKDEDFNDILTVVQDDIDIEFGELKIATESGSAGHRGIQSIINHLKTKKFKRIRLGIKNEYRKFIPTEKFVLQSFSREELQQIKLIADNFTLTKLTQ